MSLTQELQPPKVRWDLSALFSGVDDPRIEATWKTALKKGEEFAAKYRGQIDNPGLSTETLLSALHDLESIYNEVAKPIGYSHLLFATDSGDHAVGAFMQKQQERGTELSVKLLFFDLELQKADEKIVSRLMADPRLANYKHYVTVTRAFSPYRLGEQEEIILEETANTGSRAWVRLFEEVTANHVYHLHRPGVDKVEEVTQQELLALLRDPDRLVR